jgi:hypothetical protein
MAVSFLSTHFGLGAHRARQVNSLNNINRMLRFGIFSPVVFARFYALP